LDGEISHVNDYFAKKSPILENLSENLITSNIIIVRNDKNKLQSKIVKSNGQINLKGIEEAISITADYKDHLTRIKEYFNSMFYKAHIDKVSLANERKLIDLGPLDSKVVYLYTAIPKFIGKKIKRNKSKSKKDNHKVCIFNA
jgi:hypothetical protein